MTPLTKSEPQQFDADNISDLVQAIEARREGLGISVAEMAEKSVISRQGWAYIVKGERVPSIATLAACAQAVGLNLSLRLSEEE